MNRIILMGRLTRDPEIKFGGANNTAVAKYSLAVDRRFKQDGQPEADFFNIVSFNKQAEFVEKYLRKGTKIVVEGELRNNNYTNKEGQLVYNTQILTSNIEFAESKSNQSSNVQDNNNSTTDDGFMNIPEGSEEELPFN